ncbi:MAG TPA: hypothetical protein GYA07_02915 [Verrucomicrobia bacterium]|nr:hypothetical protein [Verrucomicrobiota bacterium]
MKTNSQPIAAIAAVIALIGALLCGTVAQAQVIVTTATGNGADTYLSNDGQDGNSGPDVIHGAEGDITVRTVGPNTRLKIGYIRFEKPANLVNTWDRLCP